MGNYKLSERSIKKLETVDSRLRLLVELSITQSKVDFAVIWGHRNKEEQNEAYRKENSKLQWPNSKHNSYPSTAADLAPWIDNRIDWENLEAFRSIADTMKEVADTMNISIIWGGDWENFPDYPHFELREKK